MHEIISGLLSELGKGFAGEAGKAGARALFSSRSEKGPTPPPEDSDPFAEPQEMVDGFLNALAQATLDDAWGYCDQTWADDPERSERLHVILQAAPPVSWAIQNLYAPEDWTDGDWLPWALVEVVVTFPLETGGHEVLPAVVTTVNTDEGWCVADVHWTGETEDSVEPELPAGKISGWKDWESSAAEYHAIPCTRCPQEFRIPAGYGVLNARCPACWTQQAVET